MKKILLSALFCGFVLNNGYCFDGEHKITEDDVAPTGVADALKDRLVGMANATSSTANSTNDISENGIPQTQPFVQPSLFERNFQCNYGQQQTAYFNTVPANAVPENVFQSNCMPQVPNGGYTSYIPENSIPYSAPQQMPSFNHGNTTKGPIMITFYKNFSHALESILSEKFNTVNEIIYKNPERMYMFENLYGYSARRVILEDLFRYFDIAGKLLEMVRVRQCEKKSLELQMFSDKGEGFQYDLIRNRLEMNEKLSEFYLDYLIFYIQQIDLCIYYLRSF